MHLLFCFCQSNAHPNFKNAGHIGGTALGQICGTKKDGQAYRLTISRKVLSCGRNGHTAPLISQKSSTKKWPKVFERLIPRAFILADFCAANNLHRILLSLLPIRLSTHGVSLFTVVRLTAAFALLTPSHCLYLSQNDHRTRERRHGNRGNSTIWQSKSAI